MVDGMIITIKEANELIGNYWSEIRVDRNSVNYNESQDFKEKNGFYYEECWNLDESIAALFFLA